MNRKRFIKWIFPIIALLLLLPWPIAYAYEISDAGQDTIQVEVAEPSAEPNFTAWGSAVGSVNPSDLFYIDATNNTPDIVTTLYLTNAQDLIGHYTFMILNVGVYVEVNGEWEWASGSDGNPVPAAVLSTRNGQVSFFLPGYAKYKITIDGGCFYCHNADPDRDGLSPQLFLEVN